MWKAEVMDVWACCSFVLYENVSLEKWKVGWKGFPKYTPTIMWDSHIYGRKAHTDTTIHLQKVEIIRSHDHMTFTVKLFTERPNVTYTISSTTDIKKFNTSTRKISKAAYQGGASLPIIILIFTRCVAPRGKTLENPTPKWINMAFYLLKQGIPEHWLTSTRLFGRVAPYLI